MCLVRLFMFHLASFWRNRTLFVILFFYRAHTTINHSHERPQPVLSCLAFRCHLVASMGTTQKKSRHFFNFTNSHLTEIASVVIKQGILNQTNLRYEAEWVIFTAITCCVLSVSNNGVWGSLSETGNVLLDMCSSSGLLYLHDYFFCFVFECMFWEACRMFVNENCHASCTCVCHTTEVQQWSWPIYWSKGGAEADSELQIWTEESVVGLLCLVSCASKACCRVQSFLWLVDQFYHCLHETFFRTLKKSFIYCHCHLLFLSVCICIFTFSVANGGRILFFPV